MATYFLIDVLPSCCRILNICSTSSGNSSGFPSASVTVAFWISWNTSGSSGDFRLWSFSQGTNCAALFGLARPVNRTASSVSFCVLIPSMYKAPSIRSVSTRTPYAFISTSICHCCSSASGTGNCFNRARISCSVTTSCLQYSLNRSHFFGSCQGWFHVRFPLFLVGLQGTQKYRISALPVANFCLSCGSPIALPLASSPAVYPQ